MARAARSKRSKVRSTAQSAATRPRTNPSTPPKVSPARRVRRVLRKALTVSSSHQPIRHLQSGPIVAASLEPQPSRWDESQSIPTGYGDHRIVLMVKDPWWLYAYWEIQPEIERRVQGSLQPGEVIGLRSILRVYDVTETEGSPHPSRAITDIPLSGLATNWYIHTNAPDRSFVVEIGLLTQAGRFLPLARSNRVTPPRVGPSALIDEQWMTTDELYQQLLRLTGGMGSGSSPASWASFLSSAPSSGSVSAFGILEFSRPTVRGFWCRVDTDVILHGATEPRSRVLVEGQPVAVRKDGTFSVRLGLPDGVRTVTIEVVSPDGQKTRTLAPMLSRTWAELPTADSTPPAALSARQVANA